MSIDVSYVRFSPDGYDTDGTQSRALSVLVLEYSGVVLLKFLHAHRSKVKFTNRYMPPMLKNAVVK